MIQLSANLQISRYEWAEICLRELLPKSSSPVVSDVGSGDGRMRNITESAGGQWQGFDIAPQRPDIVSWNLDYPSPNESKSPGIILLLDVLEHLNNPWLNIQNLTDTLIPGGFLIITVPNPRWSRSRFNTLGKGYPACFTQSDLDLNHHVFTPWPHIVEKLLNDTGFNVEQYVTLDGQTNLPGNPYNFRYPVRYVFSLLNMVIEKYDPSACGMSYGIVAKKR